MPNEKRGGFAGGREEMKDNRDPESQVVDRTPDDEAVTERMSQAQSVDELREIISSLVEVQTSRGPQPAAEIIRRLDQVRNGHRDISFLTRTHGIAARLLELLPEDRIYKKRVSKMK